IARYMAGPDKDAQRALRVLIFDSIVEQVTQDLLERETVSDQFANANVSGDLAAALGYLMVDGGSAVVDDFGQLDGFRFELAAAFAGDFEDGVGQPVHFAGGRADEANRFGQVLGGGDPRLVGNRIILIRWPGFHIFPDLADA